MAQSVYALILAGVGGSSGRVGPSGLSSFSILNSRSHQYAAQWAGLCKLDVIALIGPNTTLTHIFMLLPL